MAKGFPLALHCSAERGIVARLSIGSAFERVSYGRERLHKLREYV